MSIAQVTDGDRYVVAAYWWVNDTDDEDVASMSECMWKATLLQISCCTNHRPLRDGEVLYEYVASDQKKKKARI